MKKRWIPAALASAALALAACSPQQGGDASDDPSMVPTSSEASSHAGHSASAEPMASESAAPAETQSAAPTPEDYEY